MTYIRSDLPTPIDGIITDSTPKLHISCHKLNDITFIESLIVVPITELSPLLERIPSNPDMLIKLCKLFRTSVYTRDSIISELKHWYVDSNTNTFANAVVLDTFNDTIDTYFTTEYSRCNNDWFFFLLQYLSLDEDHTYFDTYTSGKCIIDQRKDIHDDGNTTYNDFMHKTYELRDIHKCISDMRSFIAVDNGDEGLCECYHIKHLNHKTKEHYINNYSSNNKKHVSKFRSDLSLLTPFRLNKNITALDIFNKYKEYFVA